LDQKKEFWEQAIKQNVKEKFVDLNVAAFNRGTTQLTD